MKSWWNRFSVRLRLTLWYTGILSLVLALYAGGVFAFLKHSLSAELDRQLHKDFEVAEQLLELTAEGKIRYHEHDHEEEDEPLDGAWLAVWSTEGKLLYRSESPGEVGVDVSTSLVQPEAHGYGSLTLPDGSYIRTLCRSESISGLPVIMQVARSEERLRHELTELLLIMGFAFPLAVGIAALGGYFMARRALAPVAKMTQQARAITAERLSDRLLVPNRHDEIGELALVFNKTFARLEKSFEQLRRFTADASHELRTPLTAIRSVGEVGLKEHREGKDYREIIGSMLEETDRLARLVDSLLTLSRADALQVRLNYEEVDLAELAGEVAEHLGVLAEEKRQTVSVESEGAVVARVDRLVLRQALINLLDNAIKYSAKGAAIRVAVSSDTRASVVEVIDNGPGIPEEHQEHVFDRFYRVDKARSRNLGGAGLGLSIARWAVDAHGGRIELESEDRKSSTFRIVLPCVERRLFDET